MSWIAIAAAGLLACVAVAALLARARLAELMIRCATHSLPRGAQARYENEWLAELQTVPSRKESSLLFGLRVLLRARHVRYEILGIVEPPWWRDDSWAWTVMRPGGDFVLLCGAVTIALGGIRAATHLPAVNVPLLLLPPVIAILAQTRGLYRTRLKTPILEGTLLILAVVSIAIMLTATAGLLLNSQIPSSHQLVKAWLYPLSTLVACRVVFAAFETWARTRGWWQRPALIIGAGIVGVRIEQRLKTHPAYGLQPIGFLDATPRSAAEVGERDVPILGTIDDLDELALRHGVRDLVVAFSSATDQRISRLIQRGAERGMNVLVVPRMFDTINNRARYDTLNGLPMQTFATVNPRGMQFAVKHALDRILALLLFIVLSPLMAAIAIAIRLTSPGPILFAQQRIGQGGRPFEFLKYRSMRTHPEEEGPHTPPGFQPPNSLAPGGVEGADRRTTIGRLLRRTSLDELPQLLNVLRGEMSLVGPRPERPGYVTIFRQDIERYDERHRVKPGITGWAQVNGLRGQTSLPERIELDSYYIAHWTLTLDFKILALTPLAMLRNAK